MPIRDPSWLRNLALWRVVALCCLFCPTAFAQSPIFVDATKRVALDFTHFNGMTGDLYLPEITGAGAALFDYDNDGDLDIYLVQGALLSNQKKLTDAIFPWKGPGPPRDRLLRNDLTRATNGRPEMHFTDVTEQSRLVAPGYGMGVTAGDIDNDGWVDLYVTNFGPNQMLHNQGDGTFKDITGKSGTGDSRWSTSAAFFDYDRDGRLDLFVTHYVDFRVASNVKCYAKSSATDYCGPDAYRPLQDRLFHNRGGGAFEDVTVSSGVSTAYGAGLGVVTADFNNDGWIDIYVANDGDLNQCWINQKDGTFKDEALISGIALNGMGQAEAGMGVDAGDFDGDGDEDLFMSHLLEESNTLYVNQGSGLFDDRTIETGLHQPSLGMTGFGAGWFDYDNDGWLDILVLNGAVRILEKLAQKGDPYPLDQPNQLFRNTGAGRFTDVSGRADATFGLQEVSRGAAFGDVDNDGDTDVLICNNSGPPRLLLNQTGNRQHWLGLRLVGKSGKRDMLGARVEVIESGGKSLWRRAHTDGSYCSSRDPRVLIGLGASAKPVTVRILWPAGQVETWPNVAPDRYITLRQHSSPR